VVSQGSAARNPGLCSIAPLGQAAAAPLISIRLQSSVFNARCRKPFQWFADGRGVAPNAEAVETAPARPRACTGLKPGANERLEQFPHTACFAPSAPFCG